MLKPSYEKVGCLEIVESVSHTAQQQSVPESKFCKEVGGDTRHSSSITCQSCLLGLGRFWKVPIANNITCDFEASAFGYFALMMWYFFPISNLLWSIWVLYGYYALSLKVSQAFSSKCDLHLLTFMVEDGAPEEESLLPCFFEAYVRRKDLGELRNYPGKKQMETSS